MTKEERENWIELRPPGAARPLLIPMASNPIYHVVTGKEVGWLTPKEIVVGSDGSQNCPAALLHLGMWRKMVNEELDRFESKIPELPGLLVRPEMLAKKPLMSDHFRMKVSEMVSLLVTRHFVRVCWLDMDEDKRWGPVVEPVATLGELADRLRELAPLDFDDFWQRWQLPALYITHDVIE